MGSIKERNGMDLREAEDIKKRRQEYTELYKKDLQDQDNNYCMISHLEPDNLECECKWALESITTNTGSEALFCTVLLCISCKDGLDKGQKWYGPNRSRRY